MTTSEFLFDGDYPPLDEAVKRLARFTAMDVHARGERKAVEFAVICARQPVLIVACAAYFAQPGATVEGFIPWLTAQIKDVPGFYEDCAWWRDNGKAFDKGAEGGAA